MTEFLTLSIYPKVLLLVKQGWLRYAHPMAATWTPEVSTFRARLPDGSEMHYSTPSSNVGTLSDDVLEQVERLNERYEALSDPAFSFAAGVGIDGRSYVGELPVTPPSGIGKANQIMYPLLRAYAHFIHTNPDLLKGAGTTRLRAMGFGPEAGRADTWHCDPLEYITPTDPTLQHWSPANAGRLVTGVDGRLRPRVLANIRFVNGLFYIKSPLTIPPSKDINDYVDGPPRGTSWVSREKRSLIEIGEPDFEPLPGSVGQFDNNAVTDIPTTGLHAPTAITDGLRVALRCHYIHRPLLRTTR